jgi:hypothetical protein
LQADKFAIFRLKVNDVRGARRRKSADDGGADEVEINEVHVVANQILPFDARRHRFRIELVVFTPHRSQHFGDQIGRTAIRGINRQRPKRARRTINRDAVVGGFVRRIFVVDSILERPILRIHELHAERIVNSRHRPTPNFYSPKLFRPPSSRSNGLRIIGRQHPPGNACAAILKSLHRAAIPAASPPDVAIP